MAIRLVIADDHPLVVQALEGLLATQEDMELVGACADGASALEAVGRLSPDVLVLDLSMPPFDGNMVLEQMQADHSPTRVVVFTGNMDERRALECLRLGVAGVVLKELPPEMLLQAIRKVAAGEMWLEKKSHSQAVAHMLRQHEARKRLAARLTPQETRVMELAARGLRNGDIAHEMHVAEGTVKVHLHHVFEKLGLHSRSELIHYAHEKGLY